jgi:hypothetical protein
MPTDSVSLPSRLAYSPTEVAEACGKHPSWAYRQIYKGKLKVVTDLGRLLIPRSELDRVLGNPARYDPQPSGERSDDENGR